MNFRSSIALSEGSCGELDGEKPFVGFSPSAGRGAEAPAVRETARRKRGEQRSVASGSAARRLL